MVCFLSGKDFVWPTIANRTLKIWTDGGKRGILIVRYGQVKWMQQHQAIILVRSRTQTAVHIVWDLCTAQCKAWALFDQQWKGSCVHYSCSCLVNKGIRDSCKIEWNKSMNSCETLYNPKNLHNMPFPSISLTSVILYLWQCFACISNN